MTKQEIENLIKSMKTGEHEYIGFSTVLEYKGNSGISVCDNGDEVIFDSPKDAAEFAKEALT